MVRLNFQSARKDLDLTQRELAEIVGVTENYVRQIENARRHPKAKVMLKFAKVLGRPSEELFADLID
ncbi:helix-turn-helix domain-containing protein [Paenibacillus alvei]|uniref:Helix-turn-helix domain-containing protein n=1 Tax=Paenibacillus alvei TaxID=44250 RepID=A0ABT4H2D7_PAEAL|nr:helix-turn-helix transcriptional regulator [Paenibacillus alvei]EJW14178.1 hypothetical protein PAV_16c00150 [Paenibacillus alvei DSM 29]MCY9540018.1 helix-turn-helix domain-containing protein [Paenibacillus alvei]MCY9705512.1 helix-turn-helix domain-containing protein [Paenibacillus alvei]MCY9735751.1 helix-turn-helix domain-containing protein [Paenibacillus alvei]MCY9756492.1 helix-turn-helix domain-containing protein [Paenibacillus alvei]